MCTINRVRLIQHATHAPSQVVPEVNPLIGQPNDPFCAPLHSGFADFPASRLYQKAYSG